MAVLAGVAGEQHMIGLVCLEQVLAEAGWTVANLGADLPAADLGAFVRATTSPRGAVSASTRIASARWQTRCRRCGTRRGDRSIASWSAARIAAVPGLVTTVEADAVVHSVGEAVALDAHRPADSTGDVAAPPRPDRPPAAGDGRARLRGDAGPRPRPAPGTLRRPRAAPGTARRASRTRPRSG